MPHRCASSGVCRRTVAPSAHRAGVESTCPWSCGITHPPRRFPHLRQRRHRRASSWPTVPAGGLGGRDLWMSKRMGDEWGEPVNLPPVNTAGDEDRPFVSADGQHIVFVTEVFR
ncbi:MAG TPA: hypothetical protein EYP55_09120 [Anaerolineae bacterium]|nr:hypothetical protein [Anaerolineae bacterium]